MKTKFISIKSAISDWIEDTGTVELSDSVVKRWAMTAIQELTTTEQLVPRLVLLDLKNYRAELPEYFKMVCQISYRMNEPGCDYYGPTQVSQWVQDAADGCELEINIKCPKCTTTKCSCKSQIIEVDIDRIHEMAHPEYYYRHYNKLRHWGYGASTYNPNFRLMKPFGSNLRTQHLPGCLNIGCDSEVRYSIEGSMLESNVEDGEILLSYMGYKTDDEGYIMVPDHPAVFDAIFFYLEYKWFWKKWRSTGENSYRTRYRDARAERVESISRARSAMEIPDEDDFNQWLVDSWLKRLPGDRYEQYSKLFE